VYRGTAVLLGAVPWHVEVRHGWEVRGLPEPPYRSVTLAASNAVLHVVATRGSRSPKDWTAPLLQ
jgi:hypothetical protein